MTDLQSIKAQASRIGAIIHCPECSHEEDFSAFLERDTRIDEEEKEVDFGCPECGNDTVSLGKRRRGSLNIVVNGLEEMEQLADE
jgi:DNA-directed RNA polymerase subunit M/transcription elongation factor TFIIS